MAGSVFEFQFEMLQFGGQFRTASSIAEGISLVLDLYGELAHLRVLLQIRDAALISLVNRMFVQQVAQLGGGLFHFSCVPGRLRMGRTSM